MTDSFTRTELCMLLSQADSCVSNLTTAIRQQRKIGREPTERAWQRERWKSIAAKLRNRINELGDEPTKE